MVDQTGGGLPESHRRRQRRGGAAAIRHQLPYGGWTVAGHGYSGGRWPDTATLADGARRRWFVDVTRVDSGGLQWHVRFMCRTSSRAWGRVTVAIRLVFLVWTRLGVTNTMVALESQNSERFMSYDWFTKRLKLNFKIWQFPVIPSASIGGSVGNLLGEGGRTISTLIDSSVFAEIRRFRLFWTK